ncbi:hypothetical protein IQ231_14110 [Cuspidothrix issatschenkoi LEGE 03284]|jgi:hypothetical protein|uniref:Cas10/Cmr2 second palm domain-containing protein n=1 Tax=Cuspidothrix issatschenkoi TaxID=230752 RepID=UPI00187E40F4|nr:hypothetical protein [Cuspidothrix issatschenkoi]MBE9232785.1 hypothetical protein [Cuspidothrix issatschenkoi LEGE 03284]
MSQFTITVIDTTGKQKYIFNSNRLRENIGASYLLSQATGEWIEDTLDKHLKIPKIHQREPIETSGFDAELIYAAGGNALIIFKSYELAIKFTEILSKRVLQEAFGINLLVAHADFTWEDNNLRDIVEHLKKSKITDQKYERVSSVPLLGLGVTASCNSTQLPAVDESRNYINYEDDDEEVNSYLISTETKHKLDAVKQANQHLQNQFLEVVDPNIYKFPYRTDHLGRTENKSSYVAIVHADGNGMGNRFQEQGKGKINREYINTIRAFSNSVDKAGLNALKAVSESLMNAIQKGKVIGTLGEFELNTQYYLPFRPLVYGGDDITFLCEGRLGIELAALFLKKFEKQIVSDNQPLTACAGISVVKTHYPFARAYQISEQLCGEAKKFVKDSRKKYSLDYFSALDWHLAASGLIGSISEIRQREYQIIIDNKLQYLSMRPVRLNAHYSEWRTWDFITKLIREFKEGEDWKNRKNKVMALREILRQGSNDAIKYFLKSYNLSKLPQYSKSGIEGEKAWLDGEGNNLYCGYFDAIEAMDFYISLGE